MRLPHSAVDEAAEALAIGASDAHDHYVSVLDASSIVSKAEGDARSPSSPSAGTRVRQQDG